MRRMVQLSNFKHVCRRATSNRWFANALEQLDAIDSKQPAVLRVLTYHRVDHAHKRDDLYGGLISATPEEFAEQIANLSRRYQFVHPSEVLEAVRGKLKLPPGALLITFDDAYRDFRDHAWPVLQRHNVIPVVFVPTAFPSDPQRRFWWDELATLVYRIPSDLHLTTPCGNLPLNSAKQRQTALRQLLDYAKTLPHRDLSTFVSNVCREYDKVLRGVGDNHVLTWQELRQLAADGVILAPHTRNHPLLTRVSVADASQEWQQSRSDLAREIGGECLPFFAYPSGATNPTVSAAIGQAGCEVAFTTQRGVNRLGHCDALNMKRINVGLGTTSALLGAQFFFLNCVARTAG